MATLTTPVPESAINRISGRLTEVYRELGSGSVFTTLSRAFRPRAPHHVQTAAAYWPIIEGMEALQLATKSLAPVEVLLAVEAPGPFDDPVTTRPLDFAKVLAYLTGEQVPHERNQWEDYEEPIWDPIWSTVRLLVREYFEQADADSD
jgi:hypothetical protein